MRDGTAGGRLAKTIGCAGWDRLAESLAESGGIRALARIVLAGMNPQGEDLLKLLGGMGPPCYYLAKGAGYNPYFKTTLSCNKSQRERNVFNV